MAQVEVVVPITHKVLGIRRRQVLHRETMVVQVVDMPEEITPVVVVAVPELQEVSGALGELAATAATASNLQQRGQAHITAVVVAVVCTVRAGQRVQAG